MSPVMRCGFFVLKAAVICIFMWTMVTKCNVEEAVHSDQPTLIITQLQFPFYSTNHFSFFQLIYRPQLDCYGSV